MRLELKLVLLVSSLTTLLLVGLGLSLGASLSSWSEQAMDADLSRRAEALVRELHFEDGKLELEDEDEHVEPGVFRIETRDGRVLRASGEWPGAALGGGGTVTVRGTPTRVLTRRLGPERGGLVVRVAAPLRAVEGVTSRFQRGLLWAVALAAVLGGLGALVLARWFLRPLNRLAEEVEALEARSLAARLSLRGLDPALTRLAGAFNGLLERVSAVVAGQRHFVARASHALRTPVAGMLTTAEVALRRERSEQEYRDALASIVKAAQEAEGLTAGLLALSRAEAAAGTQREQVDLKQTFEELERLFRPRLEAAELRLHRTVEGGLSLLVTRAHLREVLDALLDNAVRYAPRGGAIFLTAERRGARVVVTVCDTGPGVSEAERGQIFERFVRGTVGVQSGQAGSGLGLAVVKALVEAEHGTVSVSQREGGGACFAVELPASRAP